MTMAMVMAMAMEMVMAMAINQWKSGEMSTRYLLGINLVSP